jgi:hypothetical protein
VACRHRGTVANVQQALQREALPRWEAPPMTISLHLPDIACMHSNRFAAVAAAAAIGTLLVVGCGLLAGRRLCLRPPACCGWR